MKTSHSPRTGQLSVTLKTGAVAAIASLATVHLLNSGYRDWNSGADTAYVLALLLLFRAKEPVEDERVQTLRLRAISVAFFGGWIVTAMVRFAVYWQDRSVPPRTMSAYDVMFVMLMLAHALFRFWRWQDGRSAEVQP